MKRLLILIVIGEMLQCAAFPQLRKTDFSLSMLPFELFDYKGEHRISIPYESPGYKLDQIVTINLHDTTGSIFVKLPAMSGMVGTEIREDIRAIRGMFCKEIAPAGCPQSVKGRADCVECVKDTLAIMCFKGERTTVYFSRSDFCLHALILSSDNFFITDLKLEKGIVITSDML